MYGHSYVQELEFIFEARGDFVSDARLEVPKAIEAISN